MNADVAWFGFCSPAESTVDVWVYQAEGEETFVYAVHGFIADLDTIFETVKDPELDLLSQGDGEYIFRATHNAAQTGDFGRIEVPEYWEITALAYRPFPGARSGDGQ